MTSTDNSNMSPTKRTNNPPHKTASSLIPNFRMASSLPCIYRCGSTDQLSSLFETNQQKQEEDASPEGIVMQHAGLILDLRSSSERNETKARIWMDRAGFSVDNDKRTTGKKRVRRIDILSNQKVMQHLTDHWLNTPKQMASSVLFSTFDSKRLQELRMGVLNERGLVGLYEAMIETSKRELCDALCSITTFLEGKNDDDVVVVHCVQGKDRTGLVIMLCQSILGIQDEEIITDYHLSHKMKEYPLGSAAANSAAASSSSTTTKRGKLDRNIFGGAPREAMEGTLEYIRSKYGSISPGYLDHIGFDDDWRRRFRLAIGGVQEGGSSRSRL